ncbi:hypothetical protein B0T17DRAFT_620031 [Bombardia bombarda]|uniref:Uncharacterized protein n=1 Tax=Bombardia bombarda TaxID=252184 RepID=A0AA39WGZ9_9PEZI|nr:hypothetical protein B0T17DRAFT_620031 [Bombardia bombarda]
MFEIYWQAIEGLSSSLRLNSYTNKYASIQHDEDNDSNNSSGNDLASAAIIYLSTSPPSTSKHPQPATQKQKQKQCGSSPDEAKLCDCIFEPQLSAWVPEPCAFPEVVAEHESVVGI